jgi:hypothetical protein
MLSNKTIRTIYHIADIHIRPLKRHVEYRTIFDKLYTEIKKDPDDALVVICGDIVHEKDKITPELIILIQEFLTELSSITDVVLFSGNHDLIENNQERIPNLAALTPSLPNIHYLKHTGTYEFGNIRFYLKSLEDNKPQPLPLTHTKINVAIYHGMLQEIGHSTGSYSVKDFASYDLTLLGDVHERQFLTDTVAYPGSLIQQNYGEDFNNHGFIKWSIEETESGCNITHTTHDIYNDYGYINIEVVDNKSVIPESLPKYANIKYKITNSDNIDQIKEQLAERTNIQSFEVIHFNNTQSKIEYDEDFCKNIDDSEIIKRELKQGNIVDIMELDAVIKSECEFKQDQDISKYKWSIKSLEFMNLFIYGGNIKNKILFDEKDGVIGILGNNAIGKSTIFNIILFALYDKISTEYNIANVLNKDSKKMYIKLEFTIGNVLYTLEKLGSIQKTKTGTSSKYTTHLYKTDHIDTLVNLSGKDKIKTQHIINDLLGDRDTFILCNMVSNSLAVSILSMSNVDIIKSLSSLLYLDKYEDLYKNISLKLKDLTQEYSTNEGKLSIYKNISSKQLDIVEKTIGDKTFKIVELQNKIEEYKTKIEKINDVTEYEDMISSLRQNIIYVKDDIKLYNIDKLIGEYECLKLLPEIEESKLTVEYTDSLYKNKIHIEHEIHPISCPSDQVAPVDNNDNLTISQLNTIIYELFNRTLNNKKRLSKFDNKEQGTMLKIYQSMSYDDLIAERNKLHITELEDKKEIKAFYKTTLTGLRETLKTNEGIVYENNCVVATKATALKCEMKDVVNYQLTQNLYDDIYTLLDSIKSVEELGKYETDIISTKKRIIKLEDIEKTNEANTTWNNRVDKHKRINDKNEKKIEKINTAIVNLLIKNIKKDTDQMNEYIFQYNMTQQSNIIKNRELDEEINSILKYKRKLDMEKEIEIYENTKTQIEENKAIKLRNIEFTEEIRKYTEIIDTKQVSIQRYNIKIHAIETEIQQHKTSLEYENANFKSLTANMKDKNELETIQATHRHKLLLYTEYKRLTDKKCLPAILLQEKLKFIEEDVNNYLTDMVGYTIKMYIDDKSKFNIDIHKNGNVLKPYMCSGYETFILNIVLKQSLNKYCYNTKSNIFCIDEGLDCIDDTNLDKFEHLIGRLNQTYDNIILISQIDRIRKFINSEVHITNNGKYSIVS